MTVEDVSVHESRYWLISRTTAVKVMKKLNFVSQSIVGWLSRQSSARYWGCFDLFHNFHLNRFWYSDFQISKIFGNSCRMLNSLFPLTYRNKERWSTDCEVRGHCSLEKAIFSEVRFLRRNSKSWMQWFIFVMRFDYILQLEYDKPTCAFWQASKFNASMGNIPAA